MPVLGVDVEATDTSTSRRCWAPSPRWPTGRAGGQTKLGRPLSLGVFESAGPFYATKLGRALSSHFKDTDWIIHRPDRPMAWRTPQSRITDPLQSVAQSHDRNRPSSAAARSMSTTARRKPGQDRPTTPVRIRARPRGSARP
ncbi:hypothetical protein [Streptomyces capitiformicae]|uniref:hypothetical protein n=1 Tax=Streptomyces capitiformicae TaxID=2014920 RepID=UPI001E430F74|nr:hypothetical protein [Streptomyces capitiformicae]